MQLNDSLAEFTKRSVALIGVSSDKLDVLKRFSERRNIDFPLLSDNGTKIIQAFGILNVGHGIAHPTIFIVDPKGTIVGRLSESDYTERPDLSTVLNEVDTHLIKNR